MMKINPQMLSDPALGAALAAFQPEAPAAGQAAGAPAALRQQVELLNDANIKMLLDAMGKTLGEMGKLGDELPPAVAKEAGSLGQAALGADTVLPQGLAATVRGARSGGEAFAAFAQTLADAAQLSDVFPQGLKPQTAAALATFAGAISEGGDFAATLQTMARQPAATQEGQALLARLFPGGVTAETAAALETFARKISEGGDFAAKVLNMARQLVDIPDGDGSLPTAARALLATLMPEQAATAVQAELAKTAMATATVTVEQAEFAKAAAALAKDMPEKVRQAAAFHDLPE
ncbi:MAG TPA: hypothetical protein VN521_01220, partial [Negativicutes bacterium]|nr:hypothetical protein [Negativicutes bacterium]